MRLISPTASFERALTAWVAPSLRREDELVFGEIDGDDLARAGESRAEDDAQAHPAEADHGDRLPRLDLRGVDDRADPGQHRAAEQRGQLERQLWVDLHAGFARHHRMGRKRRHAKQVVDRLGAEGKPPLAGKQGSRGIGLRPRLAKRRAPGGAGPATAATRHEDEHDRVAGLEIGHPFAHSLDDSGRLVAERHRGRARPRTGGDSRDLIGSSSTGAAADPAPAASRRSRARVPELASASPNTSCDQSPNAPLMRSGTRSANCSTTSIGLSSGP